MDSLKWDVLAYEQFNGYFTGEDCRLWWANQINPSLNHASWEKEEEKTLVRLVKQHNGKEWVTIAEELGTGRSALACLQRYQKVLNPNVIKR